MNRNELIEKMHEAYLSNPASGNVWDSHKGISAALDVAVGELLREITDAEFLLRADRPVSIRHEFDRILASRRAQIEKVKTPEEQITIEEVASGWFVRLADKSTWFSYSRKDCEIYRLGLIAKLKAEA